MFKRILVAIDGSPFSAYVFPYAVEIAKCFGSEVFVLHVHEREVGRAGAFPLETVEEADTLIREAVKTFHQAGLASAAGEVQHAVFGHAAEHIVNTAAERDCDLIVMGSRGLSDIAGLMLGSVTHKVLQLGHVPVFVARGPKPAAVRETVEVGQYATVG
jgi:nucleotide-binding universal stress UspA family protein